jgi:oligopeptidase B
MSIDFKTLIDLTPPQATQVPHTHEIHGHKREDPYFWLRNRESEAVIQYLEAENEYTEAALAGTQDLQEQLFTEMKNRIQPDDSSVPYFLHGYWYYTRLEAEKEYPIFCRKAGDLKAKEQIILDVNQLAEGQDFCQVGSLAVSINQHLLAYSVDYVGRRIYSIRVRDLRTGEDLPDRIDHVTANLAWANDNTTLFYVRQDAETLRPYQVLRHSLGTKAEHDILVYQEDDDTFHLGLSKTKSREYLLINSESTLSTEVRFASADRPGDPFIIVQPRARDHEYHVDHFESHFYILTNYEAKNFRLMRTRIDAPSLDSWEEFIPHRPDTLLEDIDIFRDYLVLDERRDGLNHIRVMRWDGGADYYLEFNDPTYSVSTSFNPEIETRELRYRYTSLTTPTSTYAIDLATREVNLLKQQPVLGDFDAGMYVSERHFATAPDGTQVPISLVYKRDTPIQQGAPLLMYAYGSYGMSMDPYFSSSRLSLLNRGFAFAIAHVRGGSEMGRHWYEDGRLFQKKNTFTDFIACAEYLIGLGYTSPEQLYGMGGSAGGLLIGAVINLRPDLFHGAIADVPFVDVVTTMLDASIPLTTGEYDEWGNPNDPKYYEYILSYSPYDNVEPRDYPHLLVNTALQDSQVQYWEPAKWVARLRERKTDDHLLLLRTDMSAGHGGASGRYSTLRDLARDYAFLLMLSGQA